MNGMYPCNENQFNTRRQMQPVKYSVRVRVRARVILKMDPGGLRSAAPGEYALLGWN